MDIYTVQSGDSLSKIAEEIYGDAGMWRLIYDANRDVLSDPNKIHPGQDLQIPPPDWSAPSSPGGSGRGGGSSALRLGSKDRAGVLNLQNCLIALGYGLTADGLFGPATDRAVRELQSEHGLDVDGVVGSATHELIASLLESEEEDEESDEEEDDEESEDDEDSDEEEDEDEEDEDE